uniref:Ankyrin repeat domain-containing protein 7 n=1 Tax=Cacopsylla melanoneura TaxID=428564 RepID=A0A8D9BHC5_9HEMI
MKKVLKFVKGNKKDADSSASGNRGSKESVCIPTSSSNDSLNNNGYHVDIHGADKGMDKLHKSAYQGNMEKLKMALKVTDIDTVDELDRTALHFAITQRHTNIVWYLLNNKARMDIMDKDGFTPFLKAVQCGNTDCTHLMLERGADLDSTDDNGNTALHLATRQGYFKIAALLLQKGADLSIFNNQGEVPLHLATLGEHKDLVSLLLKYGATVNVPDRLQRTPLMLAARVGNIQLIHVFLQHGAHLDSCDSNGWTASDYALIGGHQEIAKQLTQIPRPKEKLEMLDTIGEDSELSDLDNSLDPNINNNNQLEVSLMSKKDVSVHDSPLSCVTPPPLKPPRSWDLIQSGMIDTQTSNINNSNNQNTVVQKRKSLTTLGSLESRRDSFIDNGVSNLTSTPIEELGTQLGNASTPVEELGNADTPLKGTVHNTEFENLNAPSEDTIFNNNIITPSVELDIDSRDEMKCEEIHGFNSEKEQADVEMKNETKEEQYQNMELCDNLAGVNDNAVNPCNEMRAMVVNGEDILEEVKGYEDNTTDNSESSSNSSSLLNELANNILVSQINKIVLDEKIDNEKIGMKSKRENSSDRETENESESSCTSVKSVETVLSKVINDDVKPVDPLGTVEREDKEVIKESESMKNDIKETKVVKIDIKEIEVTKKDIKESEQNIKESEIKVSANISNVFRQSRAFFENRSNSTEITPNTSGAVKSKIVVEKASTSLKSENTNETVKNAQTELVNNITMKSKNTIGVDDKKSESKDTHEVAKSDLTIDKSCMNQENLSLDNEDIMNFITERDEEIQNMIMQNNLKEHQQFLIDNAKVDGNKEHGATVEYDIVDEKHFEDVATKSTNTICESAVNAVLKMTNETIPDQTFRERGETVSNDLKRREGDRTNIWIDNGTYCDGIHNPLIESINTMNPPVNDPSAVSQYLSSVSDMSRSVTSTSSNTVCNSCIGATNTQSCDLMNKSCDYLIKNIDQVLEHINSNTSDIVQQNELLETHLSNDSAILNMTHDGYRNEEDMECTLSEDEDGETLGTLQDENLLKNAMKHLPRHKSLDLSDDSMPFILSPKVKDMPGPSVRLFDDLPPPPSDFSFPPPPLTLDDQPSSASLVSLDNLPLPPDDMLDRLDTQCSIDSIQDEEEEYGGKQLACIEEEETMSEMSNCKEIPYKNMEDYSVSVDEDIEDDGNRTPTNEDPGGLGAMSPPSKGQDYKIDIHFADQESLEKCYVFVTERGSDSGDDVLHTSHSTSCDDERIAQQPNTTHQCLTNQSAYQIHTVLEDNNLVVEMNLNSNEEQGEHTHACSEYRDYVYNLSEQSDGSHIKDQLACYDRAIEELSNNPAQHHQPQIQNGAASSRPTRPYGDSEIHDLIDKDLKCLSDQLISDKQQMYHELYSSADSINNPQSSYSDEPSMNRPLSLDDKKRKLLVSMTNIDLADEEDKDSADEQDPPFWAAGEDGGGGGRFACLRQNTVIYNEDISTGPGSNKEDVYTVEDSMSTTSSSDPSDNQRNCSPKHLNPLKSTTSILRETTLERGRLEEAVGVLRSRVEVLEYQLTDATQSLADKSDTVSALEETVAKHEATIAHHLALVNTLSYQNQNYQAEINHLTSLYTKDENVDRVSQLEASSLNLKKKVDYLNAQVNSLSEENIVLHEFIANIDAEGTKNLNVPASFKLMKKQNLEQQPPFHQSASNGNASQSNIPQEIYDDILNLKLNLEKEVRLRKKLEEEYSIELGRKLQEMEIKHGEELKKQEQILRKEKVLKIDAELRHKKELDLERQILLHEITKLKSELKTKDLHIVKLETQLRQYENEKKQARKQLIDSVNREIADE